MPTFDNHLPVLHNSFSTSWDARLSLSFKTDAFMALVAYLPPPSPASAIILAPGVADLQCGLLGGYHLRLVALGQCTA